MLPTLQLGGAELSAQCMAEHWIKRGHSVTIVLIHGSHWPTQLSPPREVMVQTILPDGLPKHSLPDLFCALLKLRKTLLASKADVVVSLLDRTNVVTLLASLGTKLRVVVSERTVPSRSPMGPIWFLARRVLFPRADGIVVVCHAAVGELPPFLRCPVRVLPGPVRPPTIAERDPSVRFRFVSLGRLAREKRFELLVAAFAVMARKEPSCELHIFGEGPERGRLEQQIESLGLAERVFLRGVTQDGYAELSRANCYVITSEFEGYPRSLAEAMLMGLPVVAFNSPGGIRDMIQDGVNGIVVPFGGVDELARAMLQITQDPALACRLGLAARAVAKQCTTEHVMPEWDLLLASVSRR